MGLQTWFTMRIGWGHHDMPRMIILILAVAAFFDRPAACEPLSPQKIKACAPHLTYKNPISYFSSEGRRIAACLGIPKPPIHVMSLRQVDPDRRKPARMWRSPICNEWRDSNFVCKYKPSSRHVTCERAKVKDREFIPKSVLCQKFIPNNTLFNYCYRTRETNIYHFVDGSSTNMSGENEASWTFRTRGVRQRWEIEVTDAYELPFDRRMDKSKKRILLNKEFDLGCDLSYTGETLEKIQIDEGEER